MPPVLEHELAQRGPSLANLEINSSNTSIRKVATPLSQAITSRTSTKIDCEHIRRRLLTLHVMGLSYSIPGASQDRVQAKESRYKEMGQHISRGQSFLLERPVQDKRALLRLCDD